MKRLLRDWKKVLRLAVLGVLMFDLVSCAVTIIGDFETETERMHRISAENVAAIKERTNNDPGKKFEKLINDAFQDFFVAISPEKVIPQAIEAFGEFGDLVEERLPEGMMKNYIRKNMYICQKVADKIEDLLEEQKE